MTDKNDNTPGHPFKPASFPIAGNGNPRPAWPGPWPAVTAPAQVTVGAPTQNIDPAGARTRQPRREFSQGLKDAWAVYVLASGKSATQVARERDLPTSIVDWVRNYQRRAMAGGTDQLAAPGGLDELTRLRKEVVALSAECDVLKETIAILNGRR